MPPPVTQLLLQDPRQQLGGTWRRFQAATVFADISGFTPLAEGLASAGVRGAEELTAILNRVFEALITAVESHGGQVRILTFVRDRSTSSIIERVRAAQDPTPARRLA